MQILIKSATDELREQRDYRDFMTIKIDGKQMFSVMDGEPEDSNLMRDFNDCWSIPDLLKMAHAAGRRGDALIIRHEKEGL